MLDKETLISQLKDIGLKKGDIVNAKVSLKSIGKIEGGPKTLIEAIISVVGPEGTIVCESFNKVQSAYFRFFRKKRIADEKTRSYAGAFVNAMIDYPGSCRSSHPIQAFTAIGKDAAILTNNFTKDSVPYSFLKTMADMGAVNLRIGKKVVGVGTTHIAIIENEFEQKDLPCGIYYKEGEKIKFFHHTWASGCPTAYNMLTPYYIEGHSIIGERKIGEAPALLTSMKKTLEIERTIFKNHPEAVFCGDPSCISCSFNWRHSTYSIFDCVKANIKNRNFKHLIYAILVELFGKWHKV